MQTEFKSLFDFHPKEQKGIYTLVVLLVCAGLTAVAFNHWYTRPRLHSQIPQALLDSLQNEYLKQLAHAASDTMDTAFEPMDRSQMPFRYTPEHDQKDWSQEDHTPYIAPDGQHDKWARTAPKRSILPATLEINGADSLTWLTIRGIGPYTARKIIQYRTHLGGFQSTAQLKEIYKIDPQLFDTCGTEFQCNTSLVRQININTCDVAQLERHPYLTKSQAKSIIAYREMHGAFASLQALTKIAILDPTTLAKIGPYLKTHE